MADPFSITAGAIGITGATTTAIGQLHTLISGYAGANEEVRGIKSGLEELQAPLSVLESLTFTNASVSAKAIEDLQKAGVAESVNACGVTCAKFNTDLGRWTRHSKPDKLSFRDKFLVGVWNKEKIVTLKTQLQCSTQTLQLAVSTTQLVAQLRSDTLSEADRQKTNEALQVIETAIKEHVDETKKEKETSQELVQQLEEEHDGSTEYDQAIAEVEKRKAVLEADQVACGVVFAQAESSRSGIDIGKVLTSDQSKAFVGLPPSVVGKVNLRVGEVTTQRGSTSFVGVFGGSIDA